MPEQAAGPVSGHVTDSPEPVLAGAARKRIVVGVGGGIAAYKSCAVIRAFTEAGHHVRVIPTESALEFVGKATFEALSGNPVHTGVFTDVPQVPHVRLGQEADLVVIAPATARAMRSAVAGAMTTRSASCPRRTCGTCGTSANTPVCTGLPDSASNVALPTNSRADSVGMTRTW